MNDETLKTLVKQEEEYAKNAKSLDAILDADEKEKSTITLEKSQKLEHDERRLRLEESKYKLEYEKFEYQKKWNIRDTLAKIGLGALAAAPGIIMGIAKIKQVANQRKYVKEAYAIDQITTLTSKTARDLLSDGTNPKL